MKRDTGKPSAIVHASNPEELRYLTVKITKLTEQNKKILQENARFQKRLQHSNPATPLKAHQLKTQLSQQQQRLQALQQKLNRLSKHLQQAHNTGSAYRLGDKEKAGNADSQMITTVADLSTGAIKKIPAKGQGSKVSIDFNATNG